MKIAVLSDAHGNLPALQAVLSDLADFQPDEILFAGDFTRGPFPNEVIELLREQGALMIRGNDDLGPLRYLEGQCPEEWRTYQSFAMLRWTARHLSPDNARFLRSLPEQRIIGLPGVDAIQVVHGSPRGSSESLSPAGLEALDQALAVTAARVLVCGHTHVQWSLRRNGRLALNPGAVAGTLVGPLAQYTRLCWDGAQWQVEPRTLDYPIAPLRQAFEERGLLEEGGPMARGFLLSMETGRDYMMAFYHHARDLALEGGWQGGPAIPDAFWKKAEQAFCWDEPPDEPSEKVD